MKKKNYRTINRALYAALIMLGFTACKTSQNAQERPKKQDKASSTDMDRTMRVLYGTPTRDYKAQPLYIIDGQEMTASDFRRIPPERIEYVEVLKDKKVLKEYGKRGKYGVIIVTTRPEIYRPPKPDEPSPTIYGPPTTRW